MPLDQDVVEPGATDRLDISLYRYQKSSAWWVNLGIPGNFFTPVQQLSQFPVVYSIQGLEYGLDVSAWPLSHLQTRLTLPIESNSFTDTDLQNHSSVRPGDLKLGMSWLGLGERTSTFRVAADGWVVFPTGLSPFKAGTPILATGLGVYRAALGVWASEGLGRFSFFQWINYEKSSSVAFDRYPDIFLPGARLYWPDRLTAGIRAEWRFFRRGPREASLLCDLRVRRWDDWRVNDVVWSPADRIFDAGLGLRIRVDKDLSIEGRWSYFPVEWSLINYRPDIGQTLTLVLCFHPFEDGQVR